ncbi:unnamed protein product, partial [Didymodactylos carnosus]
MHNPRGLPRESPS